MTVGVTATVSGIQRLNAKMNNRVNFLTGTGMRAVLKDSADDLVVQYKRTIESFTPGDVRDLAESTKKQKMRSVGFVYPILQRTMQMVNSMYASVHPPGRGWTIAIGFTGSQRGVENATIAKAHIEGTAHLPKRDFTKIPPSWKSTLYRRIRDGLARS